MPGKPVYGPLVTEMHMSDRKSPWGVGASINKDVFRAPSGLSEKRLAPGCLGLWRRRDDSGPCRLHLPEFLEIAGHMLHEKLDPAGGFSACPDEADVDFPHGPLGQEAHDLA